MHLHKWHLPPIQLYPARLKREENAGDNIAISYASLSDCLRRTSMHMTSVSIDSIKFLYLVRVDTVQYLQFYGCNLWKVRKSVTSLPPVLWWSYHCPLSWEVRGSATGVPVPKLINRCCQSWMGKSKLEGTTHVIQPSMPCGPEEPFQNGIQIAIQQSLYIFFSFKDFILRYFPEFKTDYFSN